MHHNLATRNGCGVQLLTFDVSPACKCRHGQSTFNFGLGREFLTLMSVAQVCARSNKITFASKHRLLVPARGARQDRNSLGVDIGRYPLGMKKMKKSRWREKYHVHAKKHGKVNGTHLLLYTDHCSTRNRWRGELYGVEHLGSPGALARGGWWWWK